MRTLFLAAALLALASSSTMLSGCAAIAATHTPLFKATLAENREEIFAILATDVQVQSANPEGRELLLAIFREDKTEALRLIQNGADVNARIINSPSELYTGYTPLMFAAWSDNQDIVKALITKGADMNLQTGYGVLAPILTKNIDTLRVFLDAGFPINKEINGSFHSNLLSHFTLLGKTDIVRLLLSRGGDVEMARASFENTIRFLQSDPSIANQPPIVEGVRKQNVAIELLERLSAPKAAPQTAAAGVTKDELKQMMKEAAAETSRPAPAPEAAVVYKSDVDAPAYKASENPDAYALVVGVEKYNTLPDARFAERDARAMNAHLLAMGYPQRNIVLLTGSQATRTGLAKNLEAWLPNNVTERSTVLFFFSGHGAPDAKTSQAYLVPMDGDPQYLEETAYPIKRLYSKLAALKAKRVLVALDSCFSGAGGRSVLATGTRPLVAKMDLGPAEGKIVSLSASSSDEITGALEEQGHGLFTYQLLKALTETAGRGTVSEVYASLKPRVQDEARRQNRAQTPQMFGKATEGGLR